MTTSRTARRGILLTTVAALAATTLAVPALAQSTGSTSSPDRTDAPRSDAADHAERHADMVEELAEALGQDPAQIEAALAERFEARQAERAERQAERAERQAERETRRGEHEGMGAERRGTCEGGGAGEHAQQRRGADGPRGPRA